ncbi:MAG: hypothetical protein GX786_04175 [Clostridiales bacterium]|nr:hypothetical protein [Clostridiales bacterium]
MKKYKKGKQNRNKLHLLFKDTLLFVSMNEKAILSEKEIEQNLFQLEQRIQEMEEWNQGIPKREREKGIKRQEPFFFYHYCTIFHSSPIWLANKETENPAKQLKEVKESFSYKIGRGLTYLPRKFQCIMGRKTIRT